MSEPEVETQPGIPEVEVVEDFYYAVFGMFPHDTLIVAGGKDMFFVKESSEEWVRVNGADWATSKHHPLNQCNLVLCLQLSVAGFSPSSSPTG